MLQTSTVTYFTSYLTILLLNGVPMLIQLLYRIVHFLIEMVAVRRPIVQHEHRMIVLRPPMQQVLSARLVEPAPRGESHRPPKHQFVIVEPGLLDVEELVVPVVLADPILVNLGAEDAEIFRLLLVLGENDMLGSTVGQVHAARGVEGLEGSDAVNELLDVVELDFVEGHFLLLLLE